MDKNNRTTYVSYISNYSFFLYSLPLRVYMLMHTIGNHDMAAMYTLINQNHLIVPDFGRYRRPPSSCTASTDRTWTHICATLRTVSIYILFECFIKIVPSHRCIYRINLPGKLFCKYIAYLSRDFNVVMVNWQRITFYPCYFSALSNTKLVGQCTAQVIIIKQFL